MRLQTCGHPGQDSRPKITVVACQVNRESAEYRADDRNIRYMDGGVKEREGQYQRNNHPRLVVAQVVPADGYNTQRHDPDRERFEDGQDKVRPLPGPEGKRRNQTLAPTRSVLDQ